MTNEQQAPKEEPIDINSPEAEIDPIDEQLDMLIAERDELRDKFMRALADAENSRKRADRDRKEAEQ